jgi:hypothetical protein
MGVYKNIYYAFVEVSEWDLCGMFRNKISMESSAKCRNGIYVECFGMGFMWNVSE